MKRAVNGADVAERIRQASAATDLRPDRRLYPKLDMSGPAIARRIKAASEMLSLCRSLRAARPR